MKFQRSLFIFRRDLRLIDNLALLEASKNSKELVPVFIFDPRQLSPHPYRSEPGLQFLFNSLKELEQDLLALGSKMIFLHGPAEEIISKLLTETKAEAVYCSKDYSPFSLSRDHAMQKACSAEKADFFALPNLLLNEPDDIRSQVGRPYTIYTPFAKACALKGVAIPITTIPTNLIKFDGGQNLPIFSVEEAKARYLPVENENLFVKGGRKEALAILANISKFAQYNEERNFPALSATTGLSAHNKFGTISIREFFHAVSNSFDAGHTLCRELYWRDFLTHIGFNFPHVFKSAFNRAYDKVEWSDNDEQLEAWQTGKTGFPVVDAGMREMNETGFMHNRVRMIVASFLTKDLLIDWHHGERYFAKKLVDYDPAVNNGNWQWASSTGCDAQPYFRIFNPWLQGEKFDKEAIYIKRWVPELAGLKPKQIHQIYKEAIFRPADYPAPIVDHSEQRTRAQRMFDTALKSK